MTPQTVRLLGDLIAFIPPSGWPTGQLEGALRLPSGAIVLPPTTDQPCNPQPRNQNSGTTPSPSGCSCSERCRPHASGLAATPPPTSLPSPPTRTTPTASPSRIASSGTPTISKKASWSRASSSTASRLDSTQRRRLREILSPAGQDSCRQPSPPSSSLPTDCLSESIAVSIPRLLRRLRSQKSNDVIREAITEILTRFNLTPPQQHRLLACQLDPTLVHSMYLPHQQTSNQRRLLSLSLSQLKRLSASSTKLPTTR